MYDATNKAFLAKAYQNADLKDSGITHLFRRDFVCAPSQMIKLTSEKATVEAHSGNPRTFYCSTAG